MKANAKLEAVTYYTLDGIVRLTFETTPEELRGMNLRVFDPFIIEPAAPGTASE